MNNQTMTISSLLGLWLRPKVNAVAYWAIERIERHNLICADVEEKRLKEAQLNVAHYQKRAAIARSNKLKFK